MIIRRGDIFYADLRPVIGSEQGGVRPVLIIQNDIGNRHSPTVICAAITSRMNKAKLPTHIAIDAADLVLMGSDLLEVEKAIKLSRATISNIKLSLFWAFFYNIICIPLAAGLLYPAFGLLLNPMIAAGAMSLSSVCVVTHSLRLRTKKIQ